MAKSTNWTPGPALIARPNGPTGSISPQTIAAQANDDDSDD